MYVPVLKNRMQEMILFKTRNDLFGDQIIPLIEMLAPKIGKTLYDFDVFIEMMDSMTENKFFLDFFIFEATEYSGFDSKKVEYSIKHREDTFEEYLQFLSVIGNSKKGIPVISIKPARTFLLNELNISSLIKTLQLKTNRLAVRISAELFHKYFSLIDSLLRDEDFLLYDINSETIESKYFDLKIIKSRVTTYELLVLYSSRPSHLNNGSYQVCGYTGLIDNKLREEYLQYGFTGFADYAGLKNVLPSNGGNGQGSALGLFYNNRENQFFSIMNPESKDGAKGHKMVLDIAFDRVKDILNPNNDCPAFDFMSKNLREKGKCGTFAQWKFITLLRYISQIKSNL